MYECKQNGEDFFSLLTVTCSRFGNCPANGLVTEQPQYSVAVCIFSTWQNTEISLISNNLRLIFTYPLLLTSPCIFHVARHTFAVFALNNGVDVHKVSRLLAHSSVMVTEKVYAKFLPETLQKEVETKLNFDFTPDYNTAAD